MPSPVEQFVAALSAAGPLATGLAMAALPVAVGVASYITRLGMQAKVDGLESDVRRLTAGMQDFQVQKTTELARQAEQYSELESRYQAILSTRAVLQSQLDQITSAVADIALRVDAKDYAILVPAPTLVPGDKPEELVFLCASGPQGAKLRSVRVPINKSMSGDVFLSGKSTVASPAKTTASFSSQTDKVANYRTDEALSACLQYRGERCGVVQFLNRRSGRFSSEDLERVAEHGRHLSMLVGDFVADPTRLGELGYSPRRNDFEATILYADLSGYSKLFEYLDNSVINDMLNQYFETVGNVAFAKNATIDQFIGDGILIIFGGNAQTGHRANAIASAREIASEFARLRERWVTIQHPGAGALFLRVGLASGPVTRTEIGHRQFRRVTVLGACVNEAALVCERAPRGRDTVCVSRDLRNAFQPQAEAVSDEDCGIYELGTDTTVPAG